MAVTTLLLFCLLSLRASAGIVEDAEEEMKKLREQQPGGGAVHVVDSPSMESDAHGFHVPRPANPKRVGEEKKPSRLGSSEGVGVVNIEDGEQGQRKTRKGKSTERSSKEGTYSLVGIIVLLLLVAAGAAYGKDGLREE